MAAYVLVAVIGQRGGTHGLLPCVSLLGALLLLAAGIQCCCGGVATDFYFCSVLFGPSLSGIERYVVAYN